MNLARVAERVTQSMNTVGQDAVLVRLPGKTGTRHELPVKAVATFEAPSSPTGGVVQTHREIRIGNEELSHSTWPAPIQRGDQIVMAGITYAVQGVQVAAPGDVLAMHIMQVMRMG